jgi:hypothetical protein
MKIDFACITFNTKSGAIWRPTPDKPNYLCDPKKEVDVGAYGNWVTALRGELIPLHWLIDGKVRRGAVNPISFHESIPFRAWRRFRKEFRNDRPKRITFGNLNYLEKFNVILVSFYYSHHSEFRQFILNAKERYPEKIFLGVHDFNLGRVREFWRNPDWYNNFVSFLNHTDIVILLNKVARDYYSLITNRPIVYFPVFYPTSYTKRFFVQRAEKEKKLFIAGTTERMDIVWSCLLARKLQEKFPQYVIQVCNWKNMNLEPLKGTRFEVLPLMKWEEYLRVTGKATLILNTDSWWTNGRVPSDAAAVGTPCIGVNADRQIDLFPDLVCSEVVDTRKAIDLGSRLIEDPDLYLSIQNKAIQTLEEYSYENAAKRLGTILDPYLKKSVANENSIAPE